MGVTCFSSPWYWHYDMERVRPLKTRGNVVRLSTGLLDNGALVSGLIDGDAVAAEQFCDRFLERINRWVWRLLGADADHDEVVQQVLFGVLSSLRKLRDVDTLDAFVDSVTIRTVRKEIRRRRRRWVVFSRSAAPDADEVRDRAAPLREAHIRSVYTILEEMPSDDRIVFVLRHLEGYSLHAVARFGGYSLSTAKRRLKQATNTFRQRALKDPVLLSMLEEFCHET
jgi:RNA polymerase sigma-70 factor, ECF subfamily